MAFPQHDLDGDLPKSMYIERKRFILAPDSMDISCNSYPDFKCEDQSKWITKMVESGKVNDRRFTRNAGGPYLWNTFILVKGSPRLSTNFESEQDLFKWCSETVGSFDHNVCQDVKLWLEASPTAMICHHREGLFDLTLETVARCLHVANVVSVSCFLFCLNIGTFEDENGLVIDKSRLIRHLSRLLEKWSWLGENCTVTFDEWGDYISDIDDSSKEEALKLLYQWTLSPLETVLLIIEREILDVPLHDYAKVEHVSKWGDDFCDFLEHYRSLFRTSDDTEFFYCEMFKLVPPTADLHLILGNHKRATILLEALKDMLVGVKDNDLMVTELGYERIEYLKPKGIDACVRDVDFRLRELRNVGDGYGVFKIVRLSESRKLQIEEEWHRGSDRVETHRQDYIGLIPHGRQLETIIYLMENNRYSEALAIFKQIDLNRKGRRGELSRFLEYLNRPEIKFQLHPQISPEKLESLCERQEVLLDVSEDLLDDRQLTAKLFQQYAKMIGIRSKYKCQQKVKGACEDNLGGERASSQSYLWLKEEFNLQLTLPVSECIQAVISCLRDPCEPGEHKRHYLSDTLKTYRLWKRSIDIFSELLHNWSTPGASKEVGWLKLLESQRSVHDSILCYLFEILQMCDQLKRILESYDSSEGADYGLKCLVGSNHSNLLVYRALVRAFVTSALVWVERGRARTLLAQLGSWYNMRRGENPDFLRKELIEFDKDEQAALSSIRSCTSACKAKTLFIEYAIQANESYVTYFDTAPKAFMTNEQTEFIQSVHVSNDSCAVDGRFDKQVEELLNKFYEMVEKFCNTKPLPRRLEDGVVAELHRVLEKLYDLLIEPFSQSAMFTHLDPKATIVFVPDKILYRVPFALLRNKRTQKYLFQLHPIAISPSLRVLQHCERRLRELDKSPLKPDGCILAVGNAAYEKNPLPGTRKELEYLHSSFPGRVKTLEQEEATRANFLKLVQEASCSKEKHVFAFMHLGVHGHWSKTGRGDNDVDQEKEYKTGSLQFAKLPEDSERSYKGPTTESEKELKSEAQSSRVGEFRPASAFGEVGAVTRAPDGYRSSAAGDMLSSEDIIKGGFQWRTRLVVLSACNSLRGQGYSDGEVNLPRAMMIAGVPAAVVSQWKVSDVGSPRLMKAFYERMQHGQDVATALQSAMLQLSNDPDSESANNVFEWGPFLVWGLPTVQLPKEMLTESARKALLAKRRAEKLRCEYNCLKTEDAKVHLLNALTTVNNVLEAVSNEFSLEDGAIVDAVFAVHSLQHLSHGSPFYEGSIQLSEEFFTLLPFEWLEKIELELMNRTADCRVLYSFRNKIMYTQAVKGSYLIAADYANKMITCGKHGNITNMSQIWQLNRAIILRLMGEHGEALKLFDVMLANGEDSYECLTQISYLKYLMHDRSGALEYALRAKKYEKISEFSEPGYGAFTLSYRTLPEEYRQWLLNAVDTTGASSSHFWDPIPVQFPEEPIWTKNASQKIELLRLSFRRYWEDDTVKFESLKALNAVDNFLASVDNACVLVEEGLVSAIVAMEHLLNFYRASSISEEVIALGEEFYTVLPFEQSSNIEIQLEKRCPKSLLIFCFRCRRMYTLARKGDYQTALEYANKITEYIQNANRCGYDEKMIQCLKASEGLIRQERAVILRLMGEYDKALKQFEEELAHGEDYDCLIQTSFLKHLMKDNKGALEYAFCAKRLECNYTEQKDMPGYGAFVLGVKELPNEYRQWLLNVNPTEDDTVKLGVHIL